MRMQYHFWSKIELDILVESIYEGVKVKIIQERLEKAGYHRDLSSIRKKRSSSIITDENGNSMIIPNLYDKICTKCGKAIRNEIPLKIEIDGEPHKICGNCSNAMEKSRIQEKVVIEEKSKVITVRFSSEDFREFLDSIKQFEELLINTDYKIVDRSKISNSKKGTYFANIDIIK